MQCSKSEEKKKGGEQLRLWVSNFLKSLRPESISEASLDAEILSPVFCWRKLINCFHHNFQYNEPMQELCGSVLSDLEKEAFRKFAEALPVFILADCLGWVQRIGPISSSVLVVFSGDILSLSWQAGRGVVFHEIAHVALNHQGLSVGDPGCKTKESDADKLVVEWGFSEEITAVRKYLNGRRK